MNTFKSYWRVLDPKEKIKLAKSAKTSVCYLSQIAHGHRNAGLNLILRLQKADTVLTIEMMRPELLG